MSAGGDPEARAGAVFEALSDPTRRSVLRGLAERGPLTATSLARDLPVSRQAIAKHLAVLRRAGLVEASRVGRETRFEATPARLADAAEWLRATGSAWDDRLGRLRRHLAGEQARR